MQFPGKINSKRFSVYHDIAHLNTELCLAPLAACTRPAIKTNSVQKSRFLRLHEVMATWRH